MTADTLTEYAELDAFLHDRRYTRGKSVQRKKLCNNTWAERLDEGSIGIRLHDTDVVVWVSDHEVRLNADGWFTATTKDRIDRYSPFYIRQNGRWYVCLNRSGEGARYPFFDGITMVKRDDTWVPTDVPDLSAEDAQNRMTRRFIDRAMRGIGDRPLTNCPVCLAWKAMTPELLHKHILDHVITRDISVGMVSMSIERRFGEGHFQTMLWNARATRRVSPPGDTITWLERSALRRTLVDILYVGAITSKHGRRPVLPQEEVCIPA